MGRSKRARPGNRAGRQRRVHPVAVGPSSSVSPAMGGQRGVGSALDFPFAVELSTRTTPSGGAKRRSGATPIFLPSSMNLSIIALVSGPELAFVWMKSARVMGSVYALPGTRTQTLTLLKRTALPVSLEGRRKVKDSNPRAPTRPGIRHQFAPMSATFQRRGRESNPLSLATLRS